MTMIDGALVVSAERDFAVFLFRVHLMDLEFERPVLTPQRAAAIRYDALTDWWRARAAGADAMEAGLRSEPEFTEFELRIARRVEERRALARRQDSGRSGRHEGSTN